MTKYFRVSTFHQVRRDYIIKADSAEEALTNIDQGILIEEADQVNFIDGFVHEELTSKEYTNLLVMSNSEKRNN